MFIFILVVMLAVCGTFIHGYLKNYTDGIFIQFLYWKLNMANDIFFIRQGI